MCIESTELPRINVRNYAERHSFAPIRTNIWLLDDLVPHHCSIHFTGQPEDTYHDRFKAQPFGLCPLLPTFGIQGHTLLVCTSAMEAWKTF